MSARRQPQKRRRPLLLGLLLMLMWSALPERAEARMGGGHSYSSSRSSSSSSRSSSSYRSSSSSSRGSSSSSGSSQGGSGELSPVAAALIFLFVVLWVVLTLLEKLNRFTQSNYGSRADGNGPPSAVPPRAAAAADVVASLSRHDPSFSEPVFIDFAHLLFVRFHEARVTRAFETLAPYFSPLVLQSRGPERLTPTAIEGIVIGGSTIHSATKTAEGFELTMVFRATMTAVDATGKQEALWVEEEWTFFRNTGVVSRAPETVTRLGCPMCGSAAERSALGQCAHCGASQAPGESDWAVAQRRMCKIERRPPLLTGTVEEVGTDFPTVFHPAVSRRLAALSAAEREYFLGRAREIFLTLQAGWSDADLDVLRCYETDALFDQHRFWLEQYARQGLKNELRGLELQRVEIAKIQTDAHYDSVTVRFHARGLDVTTDTKSGDVVAGDERHTRAFTEYHTFIRRRGVMARVSTVNCPSCTAELKVTRTGICAFCGTKLTRGDFDWVLSRITQDEEYAG